LHENADSSSSAVSGRRQTLFVAICCRHNALFSFAVSTAGSRRFDFVVRRVLDLNLGKSFCPSESWQLRPVLGLRGGWINRTLDIEFQGTGAAAARSFTRSLDTL
jgi:hypothetical protein